MVNWFKHDIPAWMDGTEALSDGAYRAYHVICQLIYLHEGSIALNEHGLAGRCRQSVRAFRRNLAELIDAKKLTLDNGRLRNSRADIELEKIGENRINAGKGGEKSGERRKVKAKPLENNGVHEAPLPDTRSLKEKTRQEESRADQDPRAALLCKDIVKAFERANSPSIPDTSRADLWLSQGYEPKIILATVSASISRKPSISSLNYFDKAIREAHETRAPKQGTPAEIDWDQLVAAFKSTGNWPRSAPGSEPDMDGCQVPAEILRKHGYPADGRPTPAKTEARTPSTPLRLVERDTSGDLLWQPIKNALIERIGPELVQQYFADATVNSFDGKQIVIAASSKTIKDKCDDLFSCSVYDTVRLLHPQVTKVSFSVAQAGTGSREKAA